MDDKLIEQLTKHINNSKTQFNFEQTGLAFLVTVEKSTNKQIDTIKNDIIMPKSPKRINIFATSHKVLTKISNKKNY